jgi:hypothetical protein
MKLMLAALSISLALALVAIGCRSHKDQSSGPVDQRATQGDAQTQPSSSPDNDQNSGSPKDEARSQPEGAKADYQTLPDDNSNVPTPERALPDKRPAAFSKGATRVEMRNVYFHVDDSIVLRIRDLHGTLARRNRAVPPTFDDKRTFVIGITTGTVGLSTDDLATLMNNYVFAYHGAPLKKIRISTKGDKLKMTGKVHKVVDVPFEIVGDLSATSEGKIRLHPTSVKAAGVPVKGLMHLLGLEVSNLINTNKARGVTVDNDDLILDQEQVIPPPEIRGRIVAIQVQGDEVVQVFGDNNAATTVKPRASSSSRGPNYMYFRGGTLRFGKLTMANADLRILDGDPQDV